MNRVRNTSAAMIAGLALTACGGSSQSSMSAGGTTTMQGYAVHYLVADTTAVQSSFSTTAVDAHLVNPWGIAINPQGLMWVSDQGSSATTLYDGNGVATAPYSGGPLALSIPAGSAGGTGPTGVVYNSSISGGSGSFVLSNGSPAEFIYATLEGTLEGWNTQSAGSAVVAFDGGASGDAFTGLALGQDGGGNFFLYAADFALGTIIEFDHSFTNVTVAGAFATPAGVPSGFFPYGIQNIPAANGSAQIYVAYAQRGTNGRVAPGAGAGYVAVFDSSGALIKLLISGGSLNGPWGMALAPSGFGTFAGDLLVGNFGDGKINAFNPSTGALVGAMTQPSGAAVQVSGLWGIAFGNGLNTQPTTTLFFAAGVNSEADGVYGRIDFDSNSGGGGTVGGY